MHLETLLDPALVVPVGRLAIDEKLMAEIRELHAALQPIETLFVVDAMQGQDAVNTAKAFKEALPLTGIVLTKMDGDSRGGAALSVRAITGAPIKFAGTSEKLDGLEVFDAKRHAGRILGMGDIVGLVKDFERFRAVDGLDLTVQRGRCMDSWGPTVPGSRRHCGSFWACIDGRWGRSGCSGSTPPRTRPR